MTGVMNRPEVVQFLATHDWIASVEQLRQLGVTKAALQHARRTGVVVTPHQGIVQVAGTTLSFEGRARLAQLVAGGEAFVSGPTAGALYGLRQMPRLRVEVTVLHRRRVVLPTDARLVRTSWLDDERDIVVHPNGMRVASPLRMLFGCAAQFNDHRFRLAAEDAWLKRLVTPDDARSYLTMIRRSGRAGVRCMNEWLQRCSELSGPAQSGFELDLIDAIERVGLPTPKRQHPVVLESGEDIHLDIAWPRIRLALEPGHSWWHGGELRRRRDEARDRACGVVGWQVLRYGEDARRRLQATVNEIVKLYRRRQADLRSWESEDR